MQEKTLVAIGAASIVNGLHLPLLEYDNPSKSYAIADGLRLQKKFNLHPFDLYQTTKGWHIRFYRNYVTKQILEAIVESSHCDPNYKSIVTRHYGVNRIAGKYKTQDITYKGTYGYKNNRPIDKTTRIIAASLKKLHDIIGQREIVPDRLLGDPKESQREQRERFIKEDNINKYEISNTA